MVELKEWIEDGITIRKTNTGYQVFTIPTQHFDINDLNELIPDRFKAEVERQEKHSQWQSELLGLAFGKRVEAGLFDDLFKNDQMETENLICEYSGLLNVSAYQNDICPKCSNLLDKDGIYWKCLTESNK